MNVDLVRERFDEAKGQYFAAFRLPHSSDTWFFYATEKPQLRRLEPESAPEGAFVFSPYSAGNMAYVFKPHKVMKNGTVIFEKERNTATPEAEPQATLHNNEVDETYFTAYVKDAIREIHEDRLDKLVAARCRKTKAPADPAAFYSRLLNTYPEAAVYYFHNGASQWFGATPEKLLALHNDQLSTVAIAGTIHADSNQEWSPKETEEQAMVADFIEQVLEKHKLAYTRSATETIQAGSLKHLRTAYTATLSEEEQGKRFYKILSDLNPTPAVCGIPQFDASVFIGNKEKMERRFYSGFVGLFNMEGQTDLYVNLRCMEMSGNEAILYAGAGITADSNPADEWIETEKKMQVLEKLIGE